MVSFNTIMAIKEEKLSELLKFIREYTKEYGFPPSVREMCAKFNIKSTATCQYYINKLVSRGDIQKGNANKKRAISLSGRENPEFVSVPLIGTVTAGTPVFAYENLEEYYPVSSDFGQEDELFMLRVKGESMIGAGILDGDKVIVKKTDSAENGDIVVAYFDESATVKRFFRRDGKIILHPENPALSDIVLDDVKILGTVKGLVRKI